MASPSSNISSIGCDSQAGVKALGHASLGGSTFDERAWPVVDSDASSVKCHRTMRCARAERQRRTEKAGGCTRMWGRQEWLPRARPHRMRHSIRGDSARLHSGAHAGPSTAVGPLNRPGPPQRQLLGSSSSSLAMGNCIFSSVRASMAILGTSRTLNWEGASATPAQVPHQSLLGLPFSAASRLPPATDQCIHHLTVPSVLQAVEGESQKV